MLAVCVLFCWIKYNHFYLLLFLFVKLVVYFEERMWQNLKPPDKDIKQQPAFGSSELELNLVSAVVVVAAMATNREDVTARGN